MDDDAMGDDAMGDDARTRSLQRLAYGADTPDVERAAAIRELRDASRSVAGSDEVVRDPERRAAASDASPEASPAELGPPASRGRMLRWVIGAGAAMLLIGMVVGWQLGGPTVADAIAPTPSPTPQAGPLTQAKALSKLEFADETVAAEVFDRPATPEDSPWGGAVFAFDGQTDHRLLATRADGVMLYAARDGEDLCLLVVLPSTDGLAAMGDCTIAGRFPADGITVATVIRDEQMVDGVTWRADGSLELKPVPSE